MIIENLINRMAVYDSNDSIIWRSQNFSFSWLINQINYFEKILRAKNVKQGEIVCILGDYSPKTIALILSLIKNKNIVVPLIQNLHSNVDELLKISEVQYIFRFEENDKFKFSKIDRPTNHILLLKLKSSSRPGLVLFTSGTSGKPKGIVHDFDKFLRKYDKANKQFKTIAFLMFDHIAGLDTLFYSLFSGGSLICLSKRSPNYVCSIIQSLNAEVLPTSPTFLNLMLLSGAIKHHDLTSLKIITFGSEKMPESVLKRLKLEFKGTKLIQKYGTSETGSPSSKSNKDDQSFIKIGNENFKVKIKDGILFIKSKSAMLGYLNAPSPFTKDGWFNTGDSVQIEGEYIKILGRKSEIINVGGEKVYPQEVENVILEIEEVEDVTVFSESNLIVGNIVCANVWLKPNVSESNFKKLLTIHCKKKLQRFKIPVKINIARERSYSSRFKKNRKI